VSDGKHFPETRKRRQSRANRSTLSAHNGKKSRPENNVPVTFNHHSVPPILSVNLHFSSHHQHSQFVERHSAFSDGEAYLSRSGKSIFLVSIMKQIG
jgi:hypothetical protein